MRQKVRAKGPTAKRYSEAFKPGGTNVNFVEELDNQTVFVRTYERGVENETLSCGTGVTGVALVAALKGYSSPVKVKVVGGELSVEFKFTWPGRQESPAAGQLGIFRDIFLIGPAKMVFEGDLEL